MPCLPVTEEEVKTPTQTLIDNQFYSKKFMERVKAILIEKFGEHEGDLDLKFLFVSEYRPRYRANWWEHIYCKKTYMTKHSIKVSRFIVVTENNGEISIESKSK